MVTSISENITQSFNYWQEKLQNHPTLYKAILVGAHFFRSLATFSIIQCSFLPVTVTCVLILMSSIIYRIAIEKLCNYKFAILSCFGGIAMHIFKEGLKNSMPVSGIPLIAYSVYVIHTSMREQV